jgi:pyridine nucleotide-disulfide oxidoreductase family protein
MKQLVLAGGGHAHVHVLAEAAREPFVAARLTLVSPYARQFYSGMLPGLVAGRYTADDCAIGLDALAQRARIAFVQSTATGLDAARRVLHLANGQQLRYDVLSIDTGSVPPRGAIDGADEHALFVRPIEEFIVRWERLLAVAQTRSVGVVVVGGGPAGVELALAIEHRLGERGRVSLVTGQPGLLPALAAGARARALRCLKRRRITVLEQNCTRVQADHVLLESGMRLHGDVAIVSLGAAAPQWLQDSGLQLDDRGFIATTATLQSASHPEVFAAGDVSTRLDTPHPKSGVYAVRAGVPLAINLRRFSAGGALQAYQAQPRALYLLACGDGRAIASWGGLSWQGRWVGAWKDRIDRSFIAQYASAPSAAASRT